MKPQATLELNSIQTTLLDIKRHFFFHLWYGAC